MTTLATKSQKNAANEYFEIQIAQNAKFSCEHYQQAEWIFIAETEFVTSSVVIGPRGAIKQRWTDYK